MTRRRSIPAIFKAYDIRGLYGEEHRRRRRRWPSARAFARVIAGAGGQADLRAAARARPRHAPDRARAGRRLPRRDGRRGRRRCSTPARSAPRCSTYLVGSRDLDGGLMCTASHNPKAYTGAKLVGRGALALSGDAGIGDVRDRIEAGLGDAPGGGSRRGGRRSTRSSSRRRCASSTPRRSSRCKVVVDGGNGMAGPMVGPLLERLGLDLVDGLLDAGRQLPRPRAQPAAAREPRVHHARGRRARAPTWGSPGTATPTAASSSTSTGAFVDGDFLTALLAESMLDKEPGPRPSSTTCAPAGRCADTAERGRRPRAGQPRRPRLLQDPDARRGRASSAARSPATTTSATSTARTRARCRRC